MLEPGTRIGGLLIEQFLDRGAMGEVYRALQVSLKRPVAVKRIAEHLLDNPLMVARFEREAQCIARIQHVNVVAVHEFGQFADAEGKQQYLLVMELVEGGRTLKSLMHGPMDWRSASSVILQAACGLAAAAEQGVVHRDIKPDNILVTGKGVAKLTDFGLSKSVDSAAMTLGGTLLGTPAYMPPEACRGEPTDQRGDLYSLGATWYHLLCGHIPFPRDNTMAMLRAHLEDMPPSIISLVPSVPEGIADLVRRCMAKDPQQRPASAQQVANELMAMVASGIHLKSAVPELVTDTHSGIKGEPATVATLVDPNGHASTQLTAVVPASAQSAHAPLQTAVAQPAAKAAHGSGQRVAMVAMIVLFVLVATALGITGVFSSRSPAVTAAVAPAANLDAARSPGSETPASVAPAKEGSNSPAAVILADNSNVNHQPETAATPVAKEPGLVTPIPAKPTQTPPNPPPAVQSAAPTGNALAADPTPGVPPPPPPPAPPQEVMTLPPLPAPPTLILPPVIKPAFAASDANLAIGDFRAAVRSKQALLAEAILSSIPGDTANYRDMVSMMSRLKSAQDELFASMQRAAQAGHPAELMPLAADAAKYPELATAVAQSKGYVLAVMQRWQTALTRAEQAQAHQDSRSVQALLSEVPSDPQVLPETLQSRRASVAAAAKQ